jgi:hypothetical protein
LLLAWTFMRERDLKVPTALGWLVLALGFLYLSLDEMTRIHEELGRLTGSLRTVWPIFTHRWVIIGLPAVAIVGALFIPFLLRLPRATALRLVVAGAVYVGGALGCELINGAVLKMQGASVAYLALVCLEETMEVIGILLAIRAVGLHLGTELGSPALRLEEAG